MKIPSKLSAELAEDNLKVTINNQALELTQLDAIRLRRVLNAFINDEMEEEQEE
jgi:uncharacterized membrane protein